MRYHNQNSFIQSDEEHTGLVKVSYLCLETRKQLLISNLCHDVLVMLISIYSVNAREDVQDIHQLRVV